MDSGKEKEISKLIEQHLNEGVKNNVPKQLVMCTATISKQMEELASRFFDPKDPKFRIMVEKSTHLNL
jgi:superfamily II DNA/RNA helicase